MKEYFVYMKSIKGKIVVWIFFVVVFVVFYFFLY